MIEKWAVNRKIGIGVCAIAGMLTVIQLLTRNPVVQTYPDIPATNITFSVFSDHIENSFQKMCPSLPTSSFFRHTHGPPDVTCFDLITNNLTQKQYTEMDTYLNRTEQDLYNNSYINSNMNCQEFKQQLGYHSEPVSQMEAEFPIAYNILMYKDIYQMDYLLRAIYRPQNVYCIHIDSSSPQKLMQDVQVLARCFHNVYIATQLVNVVYWGSSMLRADINCMTDHLTSDVQWKYLINTAAQAFPLKTNEEIVKILKIFNGANNVEGYVDDQMLESRTNFALKERTNGTEEWLDLTSEKNPPPPGELKLLKGSAYGVFSRQFVHFVIHACVTNKLI